MRKLFILTIALIFIGCDLILSPAEEPLIRLTGEKEIYAVNDEIIFILKNNSSERLFLNYCGANLRHYLERKENHSWSNYSSQACLALFAPTWLAVLESGISMPIVVRVDGPGHYRYDLRYKLSSAEAQERSLLVEFTVVE